MIIELSPDQFKFGRINVTCLVKSKVRYQQSVMNSLIFTHGPSCMSAVDFTLCDLNTAYFQQEICRDGTTPERAQYVSFPLPFRLPPHSLVSSTRTIDKGSISSSQDY